MLDFEWVSQSRSPLLAIMFDYGNLRARAWSSPTFQARLDETMLAVGKTLYDEQWIKAGMKLGAIRSSLLMSRYHMDFANTVKKDKRTEEDYFAMYPKTIASFAECLK